MEATTFSSALRAAIARARAPSPRAALALAVALSFALGAAAPALGASLTLENGPVVLGRVELVGVLFQVEEPPGEPRPLRLSVNVGSFGEVTRVEPGLYRAVYTPPKTLFPQVALVAAWRESGPEAPIEFMRLPLHGSTRIDAVAPPRSEVRVIVGDTEFGPVTTNARGRASVPVDVPPDVPEAVIKIKERSGSVTTRRAAVSTPPYNRLTVALVPHAILANGVDWARVDVLYDAGAVAPDSIRVVPTEGEVTLLRAEPPRYSYRYMPPRGSVSRELGFQVTVEGDKAAQGSARLALGLPPPAEIVIKPPDEPLIADGHASATVEVRVFDENRLGLPLQRIELMANGQRIEGLHYKADGVYEARFVAPATYPEGGLVRFSATVFKPDGQGLTTGANYQVLPLPLPASLLGRVAPRPVLADGHSRAVITLDVRDKAGVPLPGARLIALAAAGQGTVSPVLDLGEGRYRVDYVAPETVPPGAEALVRIVDSSNSFESIVPVPLREEHRLLGGLRAGYTHSLAELSGPRAGLDLWVPFRLSTASFALGLSATYGRATQTVEGTYAESRSQANFVPAALKLAYAPLITSRFAGYLGAGAVATWARVRAEANGYDAVQVGLGAIGFVGGALDLGPGQLFLEASWAYAPVDDEDFHLDAGGLSLELGYRFGLF